MEVTIEAGESGEAYSDNDKSLLWLHVGAEPSRAPSAFGSVIVGAGVAVLGVLAL